MRSREEINADLAMNLKQVDSPSSAALHLIAEALFDIRDLLQDERGLATEEDLDRALKEAEPLPIGRIGSSSKSTG